MILHPKKKKFIAQTCDGTSQFIRILFYYKITLSYLTKKKIKKLYLRAIKSNLKKKKKCGGGVRRVKVRVGASKGHPQFQPRDPHHP